MNDQPKRFAPNIGNQGRLLRGIVAVALLVGGLVGLWFNLIAGLLLLASGAFVLFEALRGWCALRACGVKTKF